MNILSNMLDFITFTCRSSDTSNLSINEFNVHQMHNMSPTITDKIKDERAKLTYVRKKLISEVLRKQAIDKRIKILESENLEYLNISTKEMKSCVCWDNIFTSEKESEILQEHNKNKFKDDSVIRLKIIIGEIHSKMYRCYKRGLVDKWISIEMINNLHFLEEICLEYFDKCEYEIVGLVTDYLHLNLLRASKVKNEETKNKIEEIIIRIKKHDQELRKLILSDCRPLLLFNHIFLSMPNLNLPTRKICIPTVSKCFIRNNILNCNELFRQVSEEPSTSRTLPALLLHSLDKPINMEKIYQQLDRLQNDWRKGHFTDFECKIIFFLYFIELSFDHPVLSSVLFENFNNYEEHFKDYFANQGASDSNLASVCIDLLPSTFKDVLNMWYHAEHRCLLKMCYKNFIKIANFKKHILAVDKNDLCTNLLGIPAKLALQCIKAVINCYVAYIDFEYERYKASGIAITYDLEAYYAICKIISSHLESIESKKKDDRFDKYFKLCLALKKLTILTMNYNNENVSTVLSSYTHLVEFYEEYHNTGLKIDCIYNICFVTGKASNGTLLSIFSDISSSNMPERLYDEVDTFIMKLRNTNYEIFSYDAETYDTLDHIMRCLVEIKNGSFKNIGLRSDILIDREEEWLLDLNSQTDVQSHLDIIDDVFWLEISLYANALNPLEPYNRCNQPIKKLFEAKYISVPDIIRLYAGFCNFIGTRDANEMGLLQLGVINRKNMKKIGEVLCDIIINAFRVIKCTDEINIDGLNTAQYLFRSFDCRYSIDIARIVVLEFKLQDEALQRKEMLILVNVLGIYALFEEIKKEYVTILRSRFLIITYLAATNISLIKRCGYELMLTRCKELDFDIQRSIKRPDSSYIRKFGKHLTFALESIKSTDDDVLIMARLHEFVSGVGQCYASK